MTVVTLQVTGASIIPFWTECFISKLHNKCISNTFTLHSNRNQLTINQLIEVFMKLMVLTINYIMLYKSIGGMNWPDFMS